MCRWSDAHPNTPAPVRIPCMPASDSTNLLPARSRSADAGPRFRRLPSGVVIDAGRGLHWAAVGSGEAASWQDAQRASAALRLAGHADWRLPSVAELLGLVDWQRHDPAIDTACFDAAPTWYWSATPVAGVPGCAWFVDFARGVVDFHPISSRARWRVVRDAG